MSEVIEVELMRPVNPAGRSFIRYLWGAVGARNRQVLQEYRRELSRLVQRLGFALEEKLGSNRLITGKVILELRDGKPYKLTARDLKVWQEVGSVEGEISVELRE